MHTRQAVTPGVVVIRAALKYASFGWPVLPLEPKGKAPLAKLVRHGVAHATTDARVITEWWQREPRANVGIACHELLVVDVDPRNGGHAEMVRLVAAHGPLPDETPTAHTGSGGTHVLFHRPACKLAGKLGPGVDLVHGARRYIVAAPSIHPSGGRYRWIVPPPGWLADAPDWLVAMARPVAPTPAPARLDTPATERVRRARAYARSLDPAVSGQHGHDATFRAAVRVARGFALSEDEALSVLATEFNPRCKPPWSERELRRKVRQALEHGELPLGALLDRDRWVA